MVDADTPVLLQMCLRSQRCDGYHTCSCPRSRIHCIYFQYSQRHHRQLQRTDSPGMNEVLAIFPNKYCHSYRHCSGECLLEERVGRHQNLPTVVANQCSPYTLHPSTTHQCTEPHHHNSPQDQQFDHPTNMCENLACPSN